MEESVTTQYSLSKFNLTIVHVARDGRDKKQTEQSDEYRNPRASMVNPDSLDDDVASQQLRNSRHLFEVVSDLFVERLELRKLGWQTERAIDGPFSLRNASENRKKNGR